MALGLGIGLILSVCYSSLSRKLELMDGTTFYRLRCLASVLSDVGLDHLRPCGVKIEELHSLLLNDSGGAHAAHCEYCLRWPKLQSVYYEAY